MSTPFTRVQLSSSRACQHARSSEALPLTHASHELPEPVSPQHWRVPSVHTKQIDSPLEAHLVLMWKTLADS